MKRLLLMVPLLAVIVGCSDSSNPVGVEEEGGATVVAGGWFRDGTTGEEFPVSITIEFDEMFGVWDPTDPQSGFTTGPVTISVSSGNVSVLEVGTVLTGTHMRAFPHTGITVDGVPYETVRLDISSRGVGAIEIFIAPGPKQARRGSLTADPSRPDLTGRAVIFQMGLDTGARLYCERSGWAMTRGIETLIAEFDAP